jgi:hypothetical protein
MANPGYITGDTAILADGEAWIALNSTTLTSDTAYITFTSGYNDAGQDVGGVQAWDQYMDLVMICYVRAASAANSRTCYLSLNGSSTNADYDIQQFKGNGSSATAPTSESTTAGVDPFNRLWVRWLQRQPQVSVEFPYSWILESVYAGWRFQLCGVGVG